MEGKGRVAGGGDPWREVDLTQGTAPLPLPEDQQIAFLSSPPLWIERLLCAWHHVGREGGSHRVNVM